MRRVENIEFFLRKKILNLFPCLSCIIWIIFTIFWIL